MLNKIKNKIAEKCLNYLYINRYISNDLYLSCFGYMNKIGLFQQYKLWNPSDFRSNNAKQN